MNGTSNFQAQGKKLAAYKYIEHDSAINAKASMHAYFSSLLTITRKAFQTQCQYQAYMDHFVNMRMLHQNHC